METTYNKKLIYPAMSKHLFYYRMFISKYVIEQSAVPLNPFMIYDYFLLDTVDRDEVRAGNNTIVTRCDEVWVFGAISNGVLAEINLAKELSKPIRYFNILKPHSIIETTKDQVDFEAEVKEHKGTL
jgi:hypothetical protein